MPKDGRTDRHDEANSRFFAILRTPLKKKMKNMVEASQVSIHMKVVRLPALLTGRLFPQGNIRRTRFC